MAEELEEIRNLESKESEIHKAMDMITPVRRKGQDAEVIIDGERVQMPCFGVAQGGGSDAKAQSGSDRAQGTIDQLPCIATESWNKRTKQEYEWNFPLVGVALSSNSNIKKFVSFLESRLHTRHMTMEHVFHVRGTVVNEER